MKPNFRIGIILSLMLLLGFSSCKEQGSNNKLVLNEVLVDNQQNFQDDYGVRSGWIEIFNKAYSSADLAGCLLRVSSNPGDTATYFIPKGDVLTLIKPRQHTLFWADGNPRRGTFHTNFTLSSVNQNWIGLYDGGRNLIDEVVVPAGILKTDQSYGRVSDASAEWQVKDDSAEKYVTPSTNNQTIESNPKMDKFEQHDPVGVGMAVSAMSVVFSGLLLLYICFRIVGKSSVKMGERRAMKKQEVTNSRKDSEQTSDNGKGAIPGEVMAAIAMALHEAQGGDHDVEETVLTINRVKKSYSPWNAKIYGLRELPQRNWHRK